MYEQISQGMSGLYKFWNYIEDSDINDKELVLNNIGNASAGCFVVMQCIHVLNETWKLPGCGYVPVKGE